MISKTTQFSLATLILLLVCSSAYPVDFTRVGGGLAFSTGIEDADHKTGNPGINARGVLELGEKFWLVPQLTFYMPGKRQGSTTLFTSFDTDVTFTLATEKSILFYALAGANLSYVSTKYDVRPKESKLMPALNVGTGIEMIIEKDWTAFAQIKGIIGSYKQYVAIGIGVHYYISGRRYKTW
jgi:hypothetical protein